MRRVEEGRRKDKIRKRKRAEQVAGALVMTFINLIFFHSCMQCFQAIQAAAEYEADAARVLFCDGAGDQ